MKIDLRILVGGIAIAVAATPSTARVKIATFSGTISSGYDETGVFGIAGQNLTGLNYVTTYIYDRTLGGTQIRAGQFTPEVSLGGTSRGSRSPIIDSTVTINGITRHSLGSYEGVLTIGPGIIPQEPTIPGVDLSSMEYSTDGVNYSGGTIMNYGVLFGAYSLDSDVSPTALYSPGGVVAFSQYNALTGLYSILVHANLGGPVVPDLSGNYTTYSVIDGSGGPVPEPASWAMLIAGFGLTGACLRRRGGERLA